MTNRNRVPSGAEAQISYAFTARLKPCPCKTCSFAARMVVDDPPAFRKLTEDQRKQTVRLFALGECEMKLPTNKCALRSEHLDLEVGELQLAHFSICRLIVLTIALERRLPAFGFTGARKECQSGRVPISRHEGFEVVPVPGVDLGLQNRLDSSFPIFCRA